MLQLGSRDSANTSDPMSTLMCLEFLPTRLPQQKVTGAPKAGKAAFRLAFTHLFQGPQMVRKHQALAAAWPSRPYLIPRLSKASCSARPLFHVSHLSQNLASRIFVVPVSATIGAITKLQTFKMNHCRLHGDHVWSKPHSPPQVPAENIQNFNLPTCDSQI